MFIYCPTPLLERAAWFSDKPDQNEEKGEGRTRRNSGLFTAKGNSFLCFVS